jgi:ubiquinone/menaquinone biosynthesis C-methylase UbiE
MEIFWELHSDLPQEGPGDNKSTIQALRLIKNLPDTPKILDIGCGPGRQTLLLAKDADGFITAIDTHQPFLDEVEKRATAENVKDNVITKNQSMTELDFEKGSFDIIWSEGAIYIIGFEKGLKYFKQFLKPGGCIAVTELAWIIDKPPEEVKKFWATEYPAMKMIDENMSIIKNSGYKLIDWFVIPETAWMNYYYPIEKKIAQMREKYVGNTEAIKFLDESQKEIDIFRKFSRTYGYVFYIMMNTPI